MLVGRRRWRAWVSIATASVTAMLVSALQLGACAKPQEDGAAAPARTVPASAAAGERASLAPEATKLALSAPGAAATVEVDCADASTHFRKIVSPCFEQQRLCGPVLAVDFDDAGRASNVRFVTEISGAEDESKAEAVRACVAKGMLALVNRCSSVKVRHYRHSCTLL